LNGLENVDLAVDKFDSGIVELVMADVEGVGTEIRRIEIDDEKPYPPPF
jgi:hypothetical protein